MNQPESAGKNNFVIRFANVNGTGSASANGLITRCLFRMGLTIGPKNMFPSNIQGLPTWYEIRVSEKGYTARRGSVDLMVAMNGQTLLRDQESLRTGSFLLYDSTKPLKKEQQKPAITCLPLPVSAIGREHFPNPRQRALLQNLIYVGALHWLLQLDQKITDELIGFQYRKKPALLPLNRKAIDLGFQYAKEHFQKLPFFARTAAEPPSPDPILINGNTALALGSLFAGATVCSWYPITPSTSVVEEFSKYCNRFRVCKKTGEKKFSVIQAEDEISAIGMVLGASWMGARSFTATSGPGISLMSEFLGYAYYAEVPAVIFNIQRCGPSTGMPTRSQQADLLLCAYASHGDTKHLMVFPSDPHECFEFARLSFDWAERFQTPIFVMSDLELGMNEYITRPLSMAHLPGPDRGKVHTEKSLKETGNPFYRYLDPDGDGVPYRTLPGAMKDGAYFTRGSGHDRFGRYTESSELYQENMIRLEKKFTTAANELPAPVLKNCGKKTSTGIITYGTGQEALPEAMDWLSEQGLFLNHLRIRSFPFHQDVARFCASHDRVIVLDLNRDAQMTSLLRTELPEISGALRPLCFWDGLPLEAEKLASAIHRLLKE